MKHFHSLSLLFILSALILIPTTANSLFIPPQTDGFKYQKLSHDDSSAIMVEAFVDPLCPDSRDGWAVLKRVVDFYGSNLTVTAHLFPLPYHDNAFVASRAIHIVNNLNSSATFDVLEWFFKNQQKLYNGVTHEYSRDAIVNRIANSVFKAVSLENVSLRDLRSSFNDRKTDIKTRIGFKYACARGVIGTPTFFVNGFPLPDLDSPLDFDGWRSIIDPLVAAKIYT